ncbi:MAG: WYL domain-containing protein [Gemmatimonadaceae bacterium]|nr:WYL domain-containing protein [Gemmatimonadaceae bacterium]
MPAHPAESAAAQLKRLLLALPALADDRAHPMDAVARRVGCDVATLRQDLTTLVTRVTDDPGGFTEGVQLLLTSDRVQLATPSGHFRRPMALTRLELHALELGLGALQHEAPPEERPVMRRAQERLRRALARLPHEPVASARADRYVALGRESDVERQVRRDLQRCITARCVAAITYRSARADADEVRRVQPMGVVWSRGAWYLVAWCERSEALRVFRLDRITAIAPAEERFAPREDLPLESVLRDGRVLVGGGDQVMRIRYSAAIARWISEREPVTPGPGGSVEAEYPLLDLEWGVRHALRYGADAEVLAPAELRTAVMERLAALAG